MLTLAESLENDDNNKASSACMVHGVSSDASGRVLRDEDDDDEDNDEDDAEDDAEDNEEEDGDVRNRGERQRGGQRGR